MLNYKLRAKSRGVEWAYGALSHLYPSKASSIFTHPEAIVSILYTYTYTYTYIYIYIQDHIHRDWTSGLWGSELSNHQPSNSKPPARLNSGAEPLLRIEALRPSMGATPCKGIPMGNIHRMGSQIFAFSKRVGQQKYGA